MKKWGPSVIAFLMAFFVLPISAFAADKGDSKVNPFDKLKEYVYMRWDILEGLDFVLIVLGIILSVVVLFILIKLIYDLFIWVAKVRSGKDSFKNKKFLVEAGVTVLLLFLFLSGTLFSWLGDAYDWMGNQDLAGNSTTASATKN